MGVPPTDCPVVASGIEVPADVTEGNLSCFTIMTPQGMDRDLRAQAAQVPDDRLAIGTNRCEEAVLTDIEIPNRSSVGPQHGDVVRWTLR